MSSAQKWQMAIISYHDNMMNDIITEYPNINDFIQQKLIEKCDREGISIDEVGFLVSL